MNEITEIVSDSIYKSVRICEKIIKVVTGGQSQESEALPPISETIIDFALVKQRVGVIVPFSVASIG